MIAECWGAIQTGHSGTIHMAHHFGESDMAMADMHLSQPTQDGSWVALFDGRRTGGTCTLNLSRIGLRDALAHWLVESHDCYLNLLKQTL